MVFLNTSSQKKEDKKGGKANGNKDPDYKRLYDIVDYSLGQLEEKGLLDPDNPNSKPQDIFASLTIKYEKDMDDEFKKKSHPPGWKEWWDGQKKSVPGVQKAAKYAFRRKHSERHNFIENIDTIRYLNQDYVEKVVKRYNKHDAQGMIRAFHIYNIDFNNLHEPLEEISRTRGPNIYAALVVIDNVFKEYKIDVMPEIEKIKNILKRKSEMGPEVA